MAGRTNRAWAEHHSLMPSRTGRLSQGQCQDFWGILLAFSHTYTLIVLPTSPSHNPWDWPALYCGKTHFRGFDVLAHSSPPLDGFLSQEETVTGEPLPSTKPALQVTGKDKPRRKGEEGGEGTVLKFPELLGS